MNVSISIDFSQLKTAIAQCNLEEKLELLHLLETSQELEPAVESFRRGWDDVMNGRTKPISELWDGIDVEEQNNQFLQDMFIRPS